MGAATSGSVAVVGGGLAGLSAALELAAAGRRVALFEQRRALGGRAASRVEPAVGATIDLCQHLAMGCCTEWLAFCARLGLTTHLRRATCFHLLDPQGRRHDVAPTAWLPAPWHLVPAVARLGFLSVRERVGVARAVARLARHAPGPAPSDPLAAARGEPPDTVPSVPRGAARGVAPATGHAPSAGPPSGVPPSSETTETIGQWLERHRQSPQAIEFFWKPILISALGETLDRASLELARKVFVEGLLASPTASALWIPSVPLEWLFDRLAGEGLERRGVGIHRGIKVAAIEGRSGAARWLALADGQRLEFDAFVVAVPWFQAARLLVGELRAAVGDSPRWERLPGVPITAVHLWYDQPITELSHAVLLGQTGQWWFQPPWAGGWESDAERRFGGGCPDREAIPGEPPRGAPAAGFAPARGAAHYGQVVVSASRELVGRAAGDVARLVAGELAALWPAARTARLLHARAITHRRAVFSTAPECDALRPPQRTGVANLVLAGDWTATGWPATMEGAVRSGRMAAQALLEAPG